ncbi:oligoendopeptidase, pepF/M3 family [Methylocella silvestris BL2]|uniref:Oligoendopeptidase, pepF/M3 family n=1 Tax=Methylocella silvestris (strain DSM 15510 / CIP 108128 / LMG 27833 / NCIMB 13906 / BL2) TaxID=395965 RepID=B8EQ09_METSB|nr:M3 family oligoendopeptidase [Methylocella silvestris]ACK51499.1 oligoendopeptidase, pepF/M3 family [Methylocella silvestris BL2]
MRISGRSDIFHGPEAAARQSAANPSVDLGDLPEWNLSALYPAPDSPEFAGDLARAATECKAFAEAFKGRIAELAADSSGASLTAAVKHYEALDELLGRIMSYAGLIYAGDTSDPVRAKFYGDAQEKITNASSDLLFFELELNRLDDGALDAALAQEPLAHYRPWIEDVRKGKPYQLSDELEKLFHEKSSTSYSAWNRLFDETITALRFPLDGKELSIEPVLNLLQDPNEAAREKAAKILGSVLKDNLRQFALITNTLAKDKEISDRWRGFQDVADSRHLSNRVEREVVDALVGAVRAAYPRLSHRYYRLKAKWFGKPALKFWDRNAPLPDAPARVYKWDAARDAVLGAYGDFSPKMADIARRFFDERWIDAPVRPGKSPGAFAHPTVPSAHPFVLLNYQGKPRDVMTLAHELGHGVHQVLAAHNGALMAPTPLTLAETASVFGEMLTFRALLARAGTLAERRAMLAGKVEDMLNTVVRQIAFYSFERKVHTERRKGELTADNLCDFWMEEQSESLGPAIEFTDDYRSYWAYIPHFIHSPFYVYAYAFGDCLVNSLYGVYQNASEGFAERYFALLSAGGSKPYGELLKPFGLDARDPAFWQIGLSMIEGMIAELEALEEQA